MCVYVCEISQTELDIFMALHKGVHMFIYRGTQRLRKLQRVELAGLIGVCVVLVKFEGTLWEG